MSKDNTIVLVSLGVVIALLLILLSEVREYRNDIEKWKNEWLDSHESVGQSVDTNDEWFKSSCYNCTFNHSLSSDNLSIQLTWHSWTRDCPMCMKVWP